MDPDVDPEKGRQRTDELSQLRQATTSEENWHFAEAELASAATKVEREAAKAAADLMAHIEMSVYGHS
jgi:hypothetical protein